jgi:hypothetical protein
MDDFAGYSLPMQLFTGSPESQHLSLPQILALNNLVAGFAHQGKALKLAP